ncbi:MAG: beta-L-arabinofuranosidase domain-containing protein [Acidobacteriaceae bacterium]
MHRNVSRRSFLKSAAVVAATAQVPASARASAETAHQHVHEFAYGDVKLTGGPVKEQFDRVHASYLALDNDRLLKVYRQRAGLPAPGRQMGGWYDADGFVPGHSLGQYISGLARIGAITGDSACHAKVAELVEGFSTACLRSGNPFAGPNAEKLWPCYILDKHVIGLIDAHRLSGVDEAKTLLPKLVEMAVPFMPAHGHDRIGRKNPPYDETYVMPENLFAAWEMTQDRRLYDRAMAYLLDKEFFDPLARGEDVLPGKHAYSHAIALSSAAKAYLVVGDARYRRAMLNAWDFIEQNQRYASGGWGPEEQFVEPHQGKLFASLTATKAHFETPCGSYAQTKLSRYLMCFTGDAKYGDGLERVLYNTVLGTKIPDSDGDYPYYSNYGAQATKEFYSAKWPCCSGTLVQGVADYAKNIYFHSGDSLYVNLFLPSEVHWRGMKLVQQTRYPAEDTIAMRIESVRPREFALQVRIPGWLKQPARIMVNDAPVQVVARPGSFAAVRRMWRDGDRIEVRLPQEFRTEAIDDLHPETVALMRGPVMYVALNPWDELAKSAMALPEGLEPVASQTYVRKVADREVVFVPFYSLQTESYTTYFLRG